MVNYHGTVAECAAPVGRCHGEGGAILLAGQGEYCFHHRLGRVAQIIIVCFHLQTAVHIDPTLAEGHVSLALITGFVEWDWLAAEKELQKALSLNPGLADAHHWYAHLLEALGRTNDSLLELKRAHELDPLSPIFDKDLALAYFYLRDYIQASAQLRKILEVEPGFWRGHMTMGQVYLQKQMLPEAIAELQQARTMSGSNALASAGLAHAYALFGQVAEARRILKELEDRSKSSYVLPEAIAEIHLALGEDDLAMQWLERACLNHAPRFAWLVKRDPNYDNLRGDPRFKNLLKRMRLPS
jgi:tetratricopeptide (TPR) repeat protein